MDYPQPTPITMGKPTLRRRANRGLRTTARMTRRLAPVLARQAIRREPDKRATAGAMRIACEELGATYVKFGQLVASAPGVVGDEVAEEFRNLLDRGPGVPFDQVRRVIERDLGRPLDEMFRSIDPQPLAAASIAVVHRAVLHSGEQVVLKVLRPSIASTVSSDLALMGPVIRFFAEQGSTQASVLHNYLVGLRRQIAEELDLRNEAKAMDYFRELFDAFGFQRLSIPAVYHDFTSRRVLTMEYLPGVPIDDLASIEESGIDPRPFVEELLRAWILCGLLDNVFHADIHAGNLILTPDGHLGMVDWGIVARLDEQTRDIMQGLVEASLGDERAWERIAVFVNELQGGALQSGLGLSDDEIYRLVRNMLEPVLTQPLRDVSMSVLFTGGENLVKLARGTAPPKRNLLEKIKANRRVARTNKAVIRNGFVESPFRQANFLAAKQLVYLERYARMYMPEMAILGDHPFLEQVMARIREKQARSGA